MNNFIIFLPWPPTVNDYYFITGRQQRVISSKGRKYREAVADSLEEQSAGNIKLDIKLNVECVLFPPDSRKRDLDNYMKALLDACTKGGLWVDDYQIDQLSIIRGLPTRGGIVRMEVNPAGPLLGLDTNL